MSTRRFTATPRTKKTIASAASSQPDILAQMKNLSESELYHTRDESPPTLRSAVTSPWMRNLCWMDYAILESSIPGHHGLDK